MEQTHDFVATYRPSSRASSPEVTEGRFPKLLWAGALVFTMNAIVAGLIAVSPNLSVNMYGADRLSFRSTSPAGKPSPFIEVVSDKPVRVKMAARMIPVLLEDPGQTFEIPRSPINELYQPAVHKDSVPASTSLVQPTGHQTAALATANQLDLPRVTASLMPRRSESARVGTSDVAPHRASERE